MFRRLKTALGSKAGRHSHDKEAVNAGQEGERVAALPLAQEPASSSSAALPPRPPLPLGASPFDAPADRAAGGGQAETRPGSAGCRGMPVQSMSGPPALGRTSLKQYLSRDEVCLHAAPDLQHRISQHLARVSADPRLQATAKATLRREAAEVHCLPKVSSEELLPQLESMLSFQREGAGQGQGQGEGKEQRL